MTQADRIHALGARHPGTLTFPCADSRALCDRLHALVRAGTKRATCGALRDFAQGAGPLPRVGRRDIAPDRDGAPALVIETLGITLRRFCEIEADFALAEAEDAAFADWQTGHRARFERNGGWAPGMDPVCERFRPIEDLAP